MNNRTNDLYSYATPHHMYPTLPCLESITTNKEQCVHCRSYMHSSYESDPYRHFAQQELETKTKQSPSVCEDATEWRPGTGPMISSKRAPENDPWYQYRKLQNNIPRPGFTSRNTCFGQLNVVLIPKDDRMQMRVEYPKPIDRPQVSGAQVPKDAWKYDDKSCFSGWKFTMPKSSNMKSQCIGILIDPEADEKFVRKSRNAWFLKRKTDNLAWSFNIFPPWDDHTVPSLGSHNIAARANRAHMNSSHELYCKEFGATMINRGYPVPEGSPNQQRNSRDTRLLPVRG